MDLMQQVQSGFKQCFAGDPVAVMRSPGRVNLIGEHTDYNDGFVLPMALDLAIWVAIAPNNSNSVNICASDFSDDIFSIDLAVVEQETNAEHKFLEYVKAVIHFLRQAHAITLTGCDIYVAGSVPIGAGLSSSAAFELALLRALCHLHDIPWDPVSMAALAKKCENEWVGVSCGIMDQLICALGRKGYALLIDCRSHSYNPVKLPAGYQVVVMDTSTRRGLVDSEYNTRYQQCMDAAKLLGVAMLRDASIDLLQAKQDEMSQELYKRAYHVITENERALQAQVALANSDMSAITQLFAASHTSLAQNYEVTNQALDTIVAIAQQHPACVGARMTGAGFGGCAVAIVAEDVVDDFIADVSLAYKQASNLDAKFYSCSAAAGADIVL